MSTTDRPTVRWAELFPDEFLARLQHRPVTYLPMGMVEPHGHAAVFGLDQIKADWLCEEAARRFGGIVAPPQTYAIHETGFHETWLDEVVGDVNPRLADLPPDVVMRTLLFQLRTIANAGFRSIIVISGQNGAQADLRLVADEFSRLTAVPVVVRSDPELVAATHPGDHAGRYELSQLLHIRPDLVDLDRLGHTTTSPLGRFAQNPDAAEATAAYGHQIMEAALGSIERLVVGAGLGPSDLPWLAFDEIEPAWARVLEQRQTWVSYGPVPG